MANQNTDSELGTLLSELQYAIDNSDQVALPIVGDNNVAQICRAVNELLQRREKEITRLQHELYWFRHNGLHAGEIRYAIERLIDADNQFAQDADIDAYHVRALRTFMVVTGAPYGAFGLFDDDGSLVKFITEGVSKEIEKTIGHRPEGKGLLKHLYGCRDTVRLDDLNAHPSATGFPPGHPAFKYLLSTPLVTEERLIGIVYLADTEDGKGFTQEDEQTITIFARLVTDMLERRTLWASLEESNSTLRHDRAEQKELIYKLQQAQDQLLQSEKMASIGQLAAGVAHEINNPVGYITSNVGTLKQYVDDLFRLLATYEQAEDQLSNPAAIQAVKKEVDLDYLKEDIAALLSESQEGVARVKQIVQDLKDFSHVDEAEWQWADIHQGLDSTLNIVHNEIKYKAEVIKEYADLPQIECIISQLNQVFMNLLVNAAHAIEERGAITVRTGVEAERVWVEIEDTGKGMPEDVQKRIFEPFFTTKPVGKGTGLGLSLSYSIIQKHHGELTVDSTPGQGTRFRISLPVQQVEARAAG